MPRPDETTFVIHGLDMDNRVVRATVFVQKVKALISALQAADRIVNGKQSFDFLLPDLGKGSARVTIRERQKYRAHTTSAIVTLEHTANAIYKGDGTLKNLNPELIGRVKKLGKGVAKTFSHAELGFSDNNIIRIDDFLLRQTAAAEIVTDSQAVRSRANLFSGRAIGSFDGILKEIDARGTMLRGKLVLTAGSIEIDCVMNKEQVPEARDSFDKRVVIEGFAHYDGEQPLPVRIDVNSIKLISSEANILRWKGAFDPISDGDDGEEDW